MSYSSWGIKMARDPDGKPIETRGRRSISQKTRDLSDHLKGLGEIFSGTPALLEAVASGAFIGATVYFLRPKLIVVESPFGEQTSSVQFRGKWIQEIRFEYPGRDVIANGAVLLALIVAPNIGGDVGSLIVPAGTALIFRKYIESLFPQPDGLSQGQIFTDYWGGVSNAVGKGAIDATLHIYAKYVLERWFKALMVAAFFWIILRFIRHLGRQ